MNLPELCIRRPVMTTLLTLSLVASRIVSISRWSTMPSGPVRKHRFPSPVGLIS